MEPRLPDLKKTILAFVVPTLSTWAERTAPDRCLHLAAHYHQYRHPFQLPSTQSPISSAKNSSWSCYTHFSLCMLIDQGLIHTGSLQFCISLACTCCPIFGNSFCPPKSRNIYLDVNILALNKDGEIEQALDRIHTLTSLIYTLTHGNYGAFIIEHTWRLGMLATQARINSSYHYPTLLPADYILHCMLAPAPTSRRIHNSFLAGEFRML